MFSNIDFRELISIFVLKDTNIYFILHKVIETVNDYLHNMDKHSQSCLHNMLKIRELNDESNHTFKNVLLSVFL